jgi:hypothetical protein
MPIFSHRLSEHPLNDQYFSLIGHTELFIAYFESVPLASKLYFAIVTRK